jgi:hypothetical protein
MKTTINHHSKCLSHQFTMILVGCPVMPLAVSEVCGAIGVGRDGHLCLGLAHEGSDAGELCELGTTESMWVIS